MRLPIFLSLILFSVSVSAQIAHLDLQEDCIDSGSLHSRFAATLYERGLSAVREQARPTGYDVTDSQSMGGKAQDAINELESVITFFGQLGWNDIGTTEPIILFSNFGEPDSSCLGINAYYWAIANPGEIPTSHMMFMMYGAQESPQSMADDYDNASHEYAHGFFAKFSSDAQNHEMDALNESAADMFGAAYKAWMTTGKSLDTLAGREDSYLVGEVMAQLYRQYYGYPSDYIAIRNMSDPATLNHPDYYDRQAIRSEGHHAVAEITNLAFFLMAQGGMHPRGASSIQVQGIGIKGAIEIIYYTFVHGIPFNGMPDFGDAVRKAAIRMHGADSIEYKSVDMAFQAVGLNNGLPASVIETEPEEEIQREEVEEQPPEQEVVQEEVEEPEVADEPQQEEPLAQPAISISGPTFMVILLAAIFAGSMCMVWLGRNQSKSANAADEMIVDHSGEGMLDIEKRNRAAQADTGAEPKQEPSQATEVFRPAKVKTSLVAILTVAGQRFELSLDSEPLELGRSAELNLPGALKAVLAEQAHISRRHCAIWYKSSTGELYLESRSDNVLQLAGQNIAPHSKAKIDFDQPIEITMATLVVTLEPNS